MSQDHENILKTVERYYKEYGARARELSAEGKKVIGYVCSFVPLEMIEASGAGAFRWAPHNGAVTMDFRPDRLTVWLDANNRVERANCG